MKALKYFKSKISKFHLDSINYLIGNVAIKASNLIALPFIIYLLNEEEYGYFSLINSVLIIFNLIISLNIESSIIRYSKEYNANLTEYVNSNLKIVLLYGLFVTIIFTLLSNRISNLLQLPSKFIVLVLITSYLSIAFTFLLSYLNATSNSTDYRNYSVINRLSALIITFIWFGVLNDEKFYGRLYALIIVSVFFLFVSLRKLGISADLKIKWNHLKYSLIIGIPLIPHLLSSFILSFSDRFMVNSMIGIKESGYISLLYDLGFIIIVFNTSLNKSFAPFFLENITVSIEKVKKISILNFNFLSLISSVAILLSQELFFILRKDSVEILVYYFPIVLFSNTLMNVYSLYSQYSYHQKKTFYVSIITLFAGGVNLLLNYLLIDKLGYTISIWNTLLSTILLVLFHFFLVKYFYKFNLIHLREFKSGIYLQLFCCLILILTIKTPYIFSLFIRGLVLICLINYMFKKHNENFRIIK